MKTEHKNMDVLYEAVVTEMAYGVGKTGQPVSAAQLVELIKEHEKTGARPVSLTSVVTPAQRKGGNTVYPIKKVSQVVGMLGPDYEAGVNRQREAEGSTPDYKAQAPMGKTHETRSILQGKNGPMIALQPTSTGSPTYYGLDQASGKYRPLREEEWKPFVTVPKQSTGVTQGISKPRNYRNYSVKNLVGMTMAGQDYIISDMEPVAADIWAQHNGSIDYKKKDKDFNVLDKGEDVGNMLDKFE